MVNQSSRGHLFVHLLILLLLLKFFFREPSAVASELFETKHTQKLH